MPYKSDAQRKFFNTNKSSLEKQGVDVDEFNSASKGMSLPEKVNDTPKKKVKIRVKKKPMS